MAEITGLFPDDPPTLAEQIACVRREIMMRERVYPGWVNKGRMSQTKAEHELLVMRQVLVTLRNLDVLP